MADRTDVQASFALRLVADLITALAITDRLPSKQAIALVDDAANREASDYPDHAESVREIQATLTAQIVLIGADLQNRLRKLDDDQD